MPSGSAALFPRKQVLYDRLKYGKDIFKMFYYCLRSSRLVEIGDAEPRAELGRLRIPATVFIVQSEIRGTEDQFQYVKVRALVSEK